MAVFEILVIAAALIALCILWLKKLHESLLNSKYNLLNLRTYACEVTTTTKAGAFDETLQATIGTYVADSFLDRMQISVYGDGVIRYGEEILDHGDLTIHKKDCHYRVEIRAKNSLHALLIVGEFSNSTRMNYAFDTARRLVATARRDCNASFNTARIDDAFTFIHKKANHE